MNLITAFHTRIDGFSKWLWQDKATDNNLFMRILRHVIQITLAIVKDLGDGQLSMRAMSLVYTTVIAVVPLIALSFSVLKGFGLHHQVKPALEEALVDLGDKRFDIVSNVMAFIDNVNVGVLGSVGFAILIYSVISMMHKIEHAFNYTWQIRRDRDMTQRFRDYLSVIFVGPLLIFLSAAITTSFKSSIAIDYFVQVPFGDALIRLFGGFLPFLMMSSGFALIYIFLPNTRVKISSAFVGGVVTAVVWKIMGWGVSTFIANSASNVAIYSAFASIIILMVWMYLGWLVLLIGASISFYHQNPQYLKYRRNHQIVSGEMRERLAVNIVYLVFKNYQHELDPWRVDLLAGKLGIAEYIVEDIVSELIKLGYLVRSSGEGDELYPKKPMQAVVIEELILEIRTARAEGARVVMAEFDGPILRLFHSQDESFKERETLPLFAHLIPPKGE